MTRRYDRKKMYRKTCEVCGVNFIATRLDARFHSPKCRQVAHRDTKRVADRVAITAT